MRIDGSESYVDETARLHHDGELFDGEVETTDADGNVIGLVTYWQGIPHGPQTLWYPNGQKRQEGVNNAGLPVGEWRKWHPDGRPAEFRTFDDHGQPLSRTRWDEDGNPAEDRTFTR
jgi:antitoxin component YwqK of YwqJK toxin-antitoxin module